MRPRLLAVDELRTVSAGRFESLFRESRRYLHIVLRLSNNPGVASRKRAKVRYDAKKQSPSLKLFRTPPGKRHIVLLSRFFGCLSVETKCGIGLLRKWSVKQRAILSRLEVETASNSFHLGM